MGIENVNIKSGTFKQSTINSGNWRNEESLTSLFTLGTNVWNYSEVSTQTVIFDNGILKFTYLKNLSYNVFTLYAYYNNSQNYFASYNLGGLLGTNLKVGIAFGVDENEQKGYITICLYTINSPKYYENMMDMSNTAYLAIKESERMPDIIFPMAGPLSHSGNDYSFSLNNFTITGIAGYVDEWHSIQLSGVNNFMTTMLAGDWTSIDNNYGNLGNATLVMGTLGTDMKSNIKKLFNEEISEYVLFNESDFQLSLYLSQYGTYDSIMVRGIIPYSGQVINNGTAIRSNNIDNYDNIYLVLFFNMNPTHASQRDNLWFVGNQGGTYKGIDQIGIWDVAYTLSMKYYYRPRIAEALQRCTISIE